MRCFPTSLSQSWGFLLLGDRHAVGNCALQIVCHRAIPGGNRFVKLSRQSLRGRGAYHPHEQNTSRIPRLRPFWSFGTAEVLGLLIWLLRPRGGKCGKSVARSGSYRTRHFPKAYRSAA
jgi:hypothetical protein